MENKDYLTDQIITYIGNKRQLCSNILGIKRNYFGDSKIKFLDLFAGSGIVNRCMKQDSSLVVANDLEYYSYVINKCYLANKKNINFKALQSHIDNINAEFENNPIRGIISNNYAPKDSNNIQEGERCFYTTRNAMYIDTALSYLFKHCKEQEKYLLLGPLLYEASVHVNTGGIFKGFYKDKGTKIGKFGGTHEHALSRITGNIAITAPILSNYTSRSRVYNKEALDFVTNDNTEYDIAYLDPPYNQHPYGSNYFMLNIIAKNELDSDISKISGIPSDWNRSAFNKKGALSHLRKILDNLNCKIIIMSYNSEGIIPISELKKTLKSYGTLKTKKIKYPTYKGSRNLKNRNLYVEEYIFIIETEKYGKTI